MFQMWEKYGPTHKCPDKIQLHVVEELLESLHMEGVVESASSESLESDNSDKEEYMRLSIPAVSGTTSKRSMRLQGQIGKYTTLILIDLGSSSTFISLHLANKLQFPEQAIPVAQVHVAGGGKIAC